ncbi:3-deoxy-8-phosphooctulonate synthase [bacterium E08(2017)]|nr:3-deoxy-8-phosphooctulonate synthase [bacterium E08(2017)]
MNTVRIGDIEVGSGGLLVIAGPCVIESEEACLDLASRLVDLAAEDGVDFIFKASYDKANRSSISSFRGPGLEQGLEVLAKVKDSLGIPVLTDIHTAAEADAAAKVVDVLQIPAFLCRQTDILVTASATGKPVNVKKGQFMAPGDMTNVIKKLTDSGNGGVMVTERGFSFGYNNLVVDMRGIPEIREMGYPVIFDATHSVQSPGGHGDRSGGDRDMAPYLAKAAVAAGCDGVFMETYVEPEKALCDGDNALAFAGLRDLWQRLKAVHDAVT